MDWCSWFDWGQGAGRRLGVYRLVVCTNRAAGRDINQGKAATMRMPNELTAETPAQSERSEDVHPQRQRCR